MIRRTDEAARMTSTETGKPIAQAEREWGLSCDQFRWFAEKARRIYGRIVERRVPGGRFEVAHEPIRIVAAPTAWNFPAALLARKVAPALAAGCSVIARPSSQTPGTAMVMVDCCRAGNLPKGTVNLAVGPTSATYAPVMASPAVRKVSLTGSTRAGRQMLRDAVDAMKKVTMELGGNAPLIAHDDADLTMALDAAVPTKFANAGQVCVTTDRFFIHDSLHDRFVEEFATLALALKLGDGLDPTVQMGPVINGGRLGELEGVIETAEGMANLDAIAAAPGLDGIYVGPADLTFSLMQGRLAPAFDREEPEMIDALKRIVAACKATGIRAALHCGTPDYAAKVIGWGFGMTTVGGDSRLLAAAAAASVARFRELTAGAAAAGTSKPGGY